MENHTTNKCLDKARLFVLCMKNPNPIDNKCKNLFDKWYKCILLDANYINKIKIK
jgi:hypothetical protein